MGTVCRLVRVTIRRMANEDSTADCVFGAIKTIYYNWKRIRSVVEATGDSVGFAFECLLCAVCLFTKRPKKDERKEEKSIEQFYRFLANSGLSLIAFDQI